MGKDSWLRGREFESRCRILDGFDIFFTFICSKNCNVCFKRPKINEKEAGFGPFYKRFIIEQYFTAKGTTLLKNGPTPALFVNFCSFQTQNLQTKTLGFTGIRARVVVVEGEHADHLTTTTAQGDQTWGSSNDDDECLYNRVFPQIHSFDLVCTRHSECNSHLGSYLGTKFKLDWEVVITVTRYWDKK